MSVTRKSMPWEMSITYRYDDASIDPFAITFRGGGEAHSIRNMMIVKFKQSNQIPLDEWYLPLFIRARMNIFK